MSNRVLNIGVDESNHHSYRGQEVIVAVFSYDLADGRDRMFASRSPRNYDFMKKWLNFKGRDYRFTAVPNLKDGKAGNNLVLTLPYLIQDYLRTSCEVASRKPNEARVHIDGKLSEGDLSLLKRRLDKVSPPPHFSIDQHPKGPVPLQSINYPIVVEIADALSNHLYHKFFSQKGKRLRYDATKTAQFVHYFG